MYSPETLAFEIYLGRKKKKNGNYRIPLISVWHVDPKTNNTDNSCGWFMGAHNKDKLVQEAIKNAISSNFDSQFKSESGIVYFTGYFNPYSGLPNYSVSGIVLNMFFQAAYVYFKHDRDKTKKWMNKNLFDIIYLAENPIDSLYLNVTGQFRLLNNEKWERMDELDNYVSIIYEWLLRETRPWYKHPRWDIRRWIIEFPPLRNLKRRFWDKCSVCGKRGFKESPMSDWYGKTRWHRACDQSKKSPIITKI